MANNHLHRLKLKHLSFMAILCKKKSNRKNLLLTSHRSKPLRKSGRPPFSSPPGCSRKNVAKYFRDTPTLVQASSSIGRCQGGGVTCETVLGQAAAGAAGGGGPGPSARARDQSALRLWAASTSHNIAICVIFCKTVNKEGDKEEKAKDWWDESNFKTKLLWD